MNIDIQWDQHSNHTLVCSYRDEWTWHECREAMQNMVYLQDGFEASVVNHIYDFSDSTLPSRASLNLIQKLLNAPRNPAPKYIILVDKSHRLNMLIDMLDNIVRPWGNVYFADTLSAARQKLHELEIHPQAL